MIEVVHAVHPRRHVACAHRIDQLVGARVVPAVPDVERRGDEALDSGRGGAVQHDLLAGSDRHRRSAGHGHRRASGAPCDECRPLRRDVDTVVAGCVDRERGHRRVDFHGAARLHAAQVEGDVAGGDPELQEVGLLVHETELGVAPGAHERTRADLQLEVAAVTGVGLVSRRERGVDLCGRPVRRARPPERDLAVDVAQPRRRASDRSVCGGNRGRRRGSGPRAGRCTEEEDRTEQGCREPSRRRRHGRGLRSLGRSGSGRHSRAQARAKELRGDAAQIRDTSSAS